MPNRFVIAGSDPRCRYLAQSLFEQGYDTAYLDKETAQHTNLESVDCESLEEEPANVVFSPAALSKDVGKVIRHLHAGSRVFAGKVDDSVLAAASERKVTLYNLQEDEGFKAANALPTAEGALALVIENTPMTLAQMRVLILGGGMCAKATAELFARCRALPTLVARKQKDRDWALSNGMRALSFEELRRDPMDYPVVINTVPARAVGEDVLERMQTGTLWVELASKPYGIDEQFALEIGCRYLLSSGLPGRFSPLSAAHIMQQTILEILAQER